MKIEDMIYLDIKGYDNSMSFKDYIAWLAENSNELLSAVAQNIDVMRFFQNEGYKKHKDELSGAFTLNEAIAIMSLYQSYPSLTPLNNHKNFLMWGIEDGVEYEFIVERFGIDKDKLLDKLKKLTEEQSATVIIMAIEFWNCIEQDNDNEEVLKEIFMIKIKEHI